jgi:hypothetical protein
MERIRRVICRRTGCQALLHDSPCIWMASGAGRSLMEDYRDGEEDGQADLRCRPSRHDRIASSHGKRRSRTEGHFAAGSIVVDSTLNDTKLFNHGRRSWLHSQLLLPVSCAVSCRVKLPVLRLSYSDKTYQCLRRGNGMHPGWAAAKTR